MTYIIKGGRVIDPALKIDQPLDLFIDDGIIKDIGKNLTASHADIIDANGKIVAPGLIDIHTHLREPGREDKETVKSGTRAAVRGGFTTVACMPNTEPALDSISVIRDLQKVIKKDAYVNVAIIGAITKGRLGKDIVDMEALAREGVRAFSDDGTSVDDEAVMTSALKSANKSHLLIIAHCEDAKIAANGVINKGLMSTKMGLRGSAREAEHLRVARDIAIAKKTHAAIHIAHVSCKESAEHIRRGKKEGVQVTAETAPHYYALTEECCATYDTNTKMNPPLRTREDADAIKAALKDGTIDCIATDHAPHTDAEKDVEFDYAPFGIIGLETALGVSVAELVETGILSWSELIEKLSTRPASILGLDRGTLKKGNPADVVIIDPSRTYIYTKESVQSKSKNSPFINWRLTGMAETVLVSGAVVMRDGAIVDTVVGR